VASRQAGVFTAVQALEAGWTPRTVRRRRETGAWRVVAGRGLTAATGQPGAHALAWAASLTWPDAVVAGPTAAAVWGMPVPAGTCAHVVAPRGRAANGIRVHAVPLAPGDVDVDMSGLLLTSPRSTALDCHAWLDRAAALDLYAWLSTRQQLRRAEVAAAARSRVGRPGTPQLLELLRITATGAVSAAEHRFHEVLAGAGIRGWCANAAVHDDQGVIGVVDVLFEAARLVVEIDGERAHSGRAAFRRDRTRQNRLVTAGWTVLRFTWWDVTERPAHVVAQLRAALDRCHDHREGEKVPEKSGSSSASR
jgi:hypothetical protein